MKYSKIFNLKGFSFIEVVLLAVALLCVGFLTLLGGGTEDSIKDGYSKAAATIQQNKGSAAPQNKASEDIVKDSYSKAAAKIDSIKQGNGTEKAAGSKPDSQSAEN